jgi:hypothetical protein
MISLSTFYLLLLSFYLLPSTFIFLPSTFFLHLFTLYFLHILLEFKKIIIFAPILFFYTQNFHFTMRIFPNPLRLFFLLILLQSSINLSGQLILTPTEGDAPSGQRIDIVAENFTDLLSFQFSMQWDTSALKLDSITSLNVPGMGQSSFGIAFTHAGILTTSWFDFFLSGKTLSDGTSLFSLWFSEVNDTIPNCFIITDEPTSIEVTDKNSEIVPVSSSPLCFNLKGASSRFSVFHDLDEDCEWDNGEPLLSSWGVEVSKPGRDYYFSTGSSGQNQVRLDTGTFTVIATPPSPYWQTCEPEYSFAIDSATLDTLVLAIPAQPQQLCPYMEIDISTPSLIACANNTYYVHYCNKGDSPAPNSFADIQLGPNMSLQSSSIPSEDLGNGLYRFQLGEVGIDSCGSFDLLVQLDFDCLLGAGVAHCVEAEIFPQTPCFPLNPDWNGSHITLNGECQGNDQVRFTIANEGSGDMDQAKTYVVFEDGLLISSGTYLLNAGATEDILIPINGSSYRILTTQAEGFPWTSRPSFGLEACAVAAGSAPSGLLPEYPDDDAAPFRSVDCRISRNKEALNKKQGFPLGEGPQNWIPYGTELEYQIAFQNTGTTNVSALTILDTLSHMLDLSTFQAGPASHPYTWSLSPGGALLFRFENVQLADSSSNPISSQGFVQFRISPKADLELGDIIQNRATVLMDQQAPMLTNTTFHTIQKDRLFIHQDFELCEGDTLDGTVYTEPASFIDLIPEAMFDSVLITNIGILPLSYTEFDTLLPFEGTYMGVLYTADTTIQEMYTANNGCDSLVTVNIFVTVDALEDQQDHFSLRVAPNPFTGQINIRWESSEAAEVDFRLTNTAGQLFRAGQLPRTAAGEQNFPMELSDLPAGLYFLHLQSNSRQRVIKLIKQ